MIIFHLIDSLKRGGAETLLQQVVGNLKDHKHYIITLTGENEFSEKELQNIKVISLKFKSIWSLPLVVLRLKKWINLYKPYVVHSHLPLSSLVARLSVPPKIKLIISVHNKLSESFKKISPRLFYLEKKLHSKKEILLFVSTAIREDYNQIVGLKGPSHVLYNFIADKYFADENQLQNSVAKEKLKLVSVGSLKKQKNFETLIKALSLIDHSKFTLDIFGEGPERVNLQDLIKHYQLYNVKLRGSVANMENQLKNYDAYILASRYEGFGIAPLEAAAIGLPLLLSDIDVFKEVTKGYVTYFSPHDEKDIACKLNELVDHYESALKQADKFKFFVKSNYSKEIYLDKLINIYNS